MFVYDNGWPNDPDEHLKFVYDEWNVVLVLNGLNSNAVLKKYTWGLDLSGTFHGAGGIGGFRRSKRPAARIRGRIGSSTTPTAT